MSENSAILTAFELDRTLTHIFEMNEKLSTRDKRGTPVCIWGTHGLGKTQIVTDFARRNNWKFTYCAPAQFEEMGDLHGMPEIVDPDSSKGGDEYTIYRPPEWVPRAEGPGILLIDDINRADDRILRGIMQLLQNFELSSWALPPRWQIVATANPEGGDYSITPMDDAMLTRMLHLTLKFDPKAWAAWAQKAGIDKRGIAFVLTYPEVVTGARTTPRSLTQFFEQISEIADLKAQIELVHILARSSLDAVTVTTFMAFVNEDLEQLIDPEEILDTENFSAVEKRIEDLASGKDGKRVDKLATICTRLFLLLVDTRYKPKPRHQENLVSFMRMKVLPNDMRVSLRLDLSRDTSESVKSMLRDKRLSEDVLSAMSGKSK